MLLGNQNDTTAAAGSSSSENTETNSEHDLLYNESPNKVQHASFKLLLLELWLNDEVINGYNMNYLVPKLKNGFIFKTQFNANFSTPVKGRARPTYTYSNVRRWSNRIEGGLFSLDNPFIPINHHNWLTMHINFKEREILFGTRRA